jgi:hypothetical protein
MVLNRPVNNDSLAALAFRRGLTHRRLLSLDNQPGSNCRNRGKIYRQGL